MSNSLDLSSSGILVKGEKGFVDLKELMFSSEHQIIILDTETKKAEQKYISRLPLIFSIDFRGKAKNPPEIVLLINPESLSFSTSKKINSQYTRGGYVTEEWGNMQENLQFSGRIGGFYVLNPQIDFSGLNRYERSKSPSFKNLMNLFMMYRNNGMIYDNTTKASEGNKSNKLIRNKKLASVNNRIPKMIKKAKNRIVDIGDVYLNYDGIIYRGSFDEFSIEESADSPYTLSYKFGFTVRSRREINKRPELVYTQNSNDPRDSSVNRDAANRIQKFKETVNNISTSEIQANSTNRTVDGVSSITKSEVVRETLRSQINYFNDEKLNLDNEDINNLASDFNKINSSNFQESQEGIFSNFTTNMKILGKNNQGSNFEKGQQITQKAVQTLNEKKKLSSK
jgi:hypothetical protein